MTRDAFYTCIRAHGLNSPFAVSASRVGGGPVSSLYGERSVDGRYLGVSADTSDNRRCSNFFLSFAIEDAHR